MIIKCLCEDLAVTDDGTNDVAETGPAKCPVFKAFGIEHLPGQDYYDDGYPVIQRGDATSEFPATVMAPTSESPTQLCDTCTHSPVCLVASAVRTLDCLPVVSACALHAPSADAVDERTSI